MSYESKIKSLEDILQSYNEGLKSRGAESSSPLLLDIKETVDRLIKLGATSEESLNQCSYEDLESCGIPKLLAKQIASVFRSGDRAETENPAYVSSKKAERMTVEELFAHYDPDESNAVSKRLKELSNGKACVVFKEGNVVDIQTSAMLLNELKKGYEERYIGINIDGVIRKIFRVGSKPDNLVDENPLYPGRALRPDGTCDQTNRSWAGVPLKIRQLFYLAVSETREIGRTLENFNDILDKALQTNPSLLSPSDNWVYFATRYPKAAMQFQEDQKIGRLPLLKIEFGKQSNRGLLNGGKKVDFDE